MVRFYIFMVIFHTNFITFALILVSFTLWHILWVLSMIHHMVLPTLSSFLHNAEATGEKYREIARAMGVKGVDDMTQEEYRKAAVDAVKQLSQDVGIPGDLKDIVKREDIPFLAQSAYDDACRPGNPKETSVEDITKLYESLL